MKRIIALLLIAVVLIAAKNGDIQVCEDYLFAGRPAPDVSPGFYVERIVCLTPDHRLVPVLHPSDMPGLQAENEALRMELLATQRLAEARLMELVRVFSIQEGDLAFHPVIYIAEEHY